MLVSVCVCVCVCVCVRSVSVCACVRACVHVCSGCAFCRCAALSACVTLLGSPCRESALACCIQTHSTVRLLHPVATCTVGTHAHRRRRRRRRCRTDRVAERLNLHAHVCLCGTCACMCGRASFWVPAWMIASGWMQARLGTKRRDSALRARVSGCGGWEAVSGQEGIGGGG